MQWRLFIEEFSPTFHFIEGEKNTLADILSRLPFSKRQSAALNPQDQYRDADLFNKKTYQHDPMDPNHDPSDPLSHQYYSMATELSDDMPHCFAHPPHKRGFPSNSTFEVSLQRKDGTPDLCVKKRNIHFSTWAGCLHPMLLLAVSAQPEDLGRSTYRTSIGERRSLV